MTIESEPKQSLSEKRINAIRERLTADLQPSNLEIEDQSHLHAGHAGAKSGKGHFDVTVVSAQFDGKSLIQRHRAIYAALGGLMDSDIHALSISALTSAEN